MPLKHYAISDILPELKHLGFLRDHLEKTKDNSFILNLSQNTKVRRKMSSESFIIKHNSICRFRSC
ncbi:MAG TPA: hypothetical protein VEL11_06955, partial [Candidatus Bathyarchaeia archaeon]|nr:hypothetical protein [Candidatus Bathyarchaeia archaeon]